MQTNHGKTIMFYQSFMQGVDNALWQSLMTIVLVVAFGSP